MSKFGLCLGQNYEHGAATMLYEAGTWCRSSFIYGVGVFTYRQPVYGAVAVYSLYSIHVAGTFYCLYFHTVPEQCTAVHGAEVQLIDGRRSLLLVVRGTGTAYNQYRVPELCTASP
jgi:hypothetical protein